MKAKALILWRSEDKTRGDAIRVEATDVALAEALRNLIPKIVEALDKAPDEQCLGWYHVSITVDRA